MMILSSIANALRLMHRDKLEPDFIRRYRKDYVTSPAVRKHLYTIMDEDNEWDRILSGRGKVRKLLSLITSASNMDNVIHGSGGAGGTTSVVDTIQQLTEDLQVAQDELNDKKTKLQQMQMELDTLVAKEDDDDDDELFEDDDDDDQEKAEVSIHFFNAEKKCSTCILFLVV
jgi:transcription elongation factor SPT6